MSYETILFDKQEAVARITLNRPEAMNAMNETMFREIGSALLDAENDDEIKAVVITGAGKAFCAGVDLKFAKENLKTLKEREAFYRLGSSEKLDRMEAMSKPVIAAVNGYALAGGFEILLACDLAIAAEDAKIGDQHMKYGRFGAGGSPYRLTQLVGIRRAKEIVLTGKLISGKEAEQIGLVNSAVPAGELDDAVDKLLSELIDKSPTTMKISKMSINKAACVDSQTKYELILMAALVNSASDDFAEGVNAFIEKRPPKLSQ